MIAFSFAHFLVGTALRSFTSFILFSFVDYLRRLALSHTLESGTAFHVLLVLNRMCFFRVCVRVCVWVWVRNIAQNLCASFPWSLASSRGRGLLRFDNVCTEFSCTGFEQFVLPSFSHGAQVPVFLLLSFLTWFQRLAFSQSFGGKFCS